MLTFIFLIKFVHKNISFKAVESVKAHIYLISLNDIFFKLS